MITWPQITLWIQLPWYKLIIESKEGSPRSPSALYLRQICTRLLKLSGQRLRLCKHLAEPFRIWPVYSGDRREKIRSCFKSCLSALSTEGYEEARLVVPLEWVSPERTWSPPFAVKGFVTHWLQAQDSRLASDRALLIPFSQAVKQRSCESSLYHHCAQKKIISK